VTLNRDGAIDPDKVISRMEYAHPVLDAAAVVAQGRRGEVNGHRRTWYVGAYWGYGFHEDGVRSATEACAGLGVTM
jgi:predicted NAD/FAD-binding protein